jgi:hypothetical protein
MIQIHTHHTDSSPIFSASIEDVLHFTRTITHNYNLFIVIVVIMIITMSMMINSFLSLLILMLHHEVHHTVPLLAHSFLIPTSKITSCISLALERHVGGTFYTLHQKVETLVGLQYDFRQLGSGRVEDTFMF